MKHKRIESFLTFAMNKSGLFEFDSGGNVRVKNSDKALRWITENRIAALIGAFIDLKDPKVVNTCKKIMIRDFVGQMQLETFRAMTLEILSESGIEVLLMKGPCVSSLYPHTKLRPYGDVDLFIKSDNLKKSALDILLILNGFTILGIFVASFILGTFWTPQSGGFTRWLVGQGIFQSENLFIDFFVQFLYYILWGFAQQVLR